MVQLASSIKTERLLLRNFREDDLDDLAPLFGDASVNRYLYSEPRTRDETAASLQRRRAAPMGVDPNEKSVLVFAVEERATSRLIGDFMLAWEPNEHRQGEMGGILGPSVHSRGFATEIYGAILQVAFATYELHRVIGRTDERNVASIRSLEKAGLTKEAHFKENEFVKGEWTSEVVLAILREHWLNAQSH